jgi:hypothetical protein
MIDRELAEAGWSTDGSFSEYLSIGESGDLCVLFTAALGRQTSPPPKSYTTWGDTSPTGFVRIRRPTEPLHCWRSTGRLPRRSERRLVSP